nr:MAG TPA: hypothetical protein [Caudoviricetes sp.]
MIIVTDESARRAGAILTNKQQRHDKTMIR